MSGAPRPDGGSLRFDTEPISFAEYTVRKAKEEGIRVVHQELSVCTNLNVAENFFLELNQLFPAGSWRQKAGELAQKTLATIFPKNQVAASANVGSLSLAQQQMVEIARAAADPRLNLPSFWTIPSQFLTGAAAAAGIALINTAGNFAGFAAGYITGALKDWTGSYIVPMFLVGGFMLLSAICMVAISAQAKSAHLPKSSTIS